MMVSRHTIVMYADIKVGYINKIKEEIYMNRLQVELDIENIENLCDHATSGNVSHIVGTIKSHCRMMKEELDVPDWSYYRIQASITAMQGLLCAPSYEADRSKLDMIAKDAISIADALIEELKKK